MKTAKLLKTGIAVLVAALLMMSLFALPVLADETNEPAKKGLTTEQIVTIVVCAVIVVVAVVLCICFRTKIGKFLRVYKSEAKKIVWLTWEQTRKSTLVVLVVLIIFAAAICLIDLGLNTGFVQIINLF